jgi:hypothetical protein
MVNNPHPIDVMCEQAMQRLRDSIIADAHTHSVMIAEGFFRARRSLQNRYLDNKTVTAVRFRHAFKQCGMFEHAMLLKLHMNSIY